MSFESALIALFAVATAVALVARWLNMPYTVALVLAGLGLGVARVISPPHLDKQTLYAVFLPGLLFEAAFHMDLRHFWRNLPVIGGLAVPGVLASGFLTALLLLPAMALLRAEPGLGYGHALVFGALIAATDPIAVVALFNALHVPRRLAILVEGESLINDGTAAAFYAVVVAVAGGAGVSVWRGAFDFVAVSGLGAIVGAAVGFAVSRVIRRVDEPMIEITLTTIAAYGSFVLGESVHGSGVIATVAAGLVCGNYAARIGMSATTRIAVESFWEYVAFGLNSLVFLLIGMEVHVSRLLARWDVIVAAWLVVTLVRALVVAAAAALAWPSRQRLSWRWTVVLGWGGLRGALAMVLALSLAPDFPHRPLVVTITFGVVVLSILVQGLTMRPLLRRLGIGRAAPEIDHVAACRGEREAARAALAALERTPPEELPAADVVQALRREYAARLGAAEAALRAEPATRSPAAAEEQLRRRLTIVEKDALLRAYRRGTIDRHTRDELVRARDERLFAAEHAGEGED